MMLPVDILVSGSWRTGHSGNVGGTVAQTSGHLDTRDIGSVPSLVLRCTSGVSFLVHGISTRTRTRTSKYF